LAKELHCNEIMNHEVMIMVGEILDREKDIDYILSYTIEMFHNSHILYSYASIKKTPLTFMKKLMRQDEWFFTQKVSCIPYIVKIDDYVDGIIPDFIYDKIENIKQYGIEDFYVAYPVIAKLPQVDPIVFVKLGNEMIFIGKW